MLFLENDDFVLATLTCTPSSEGQGKFHAALYIFIQARHNVSDLNGQTRCANVALGTNRTLALESLYGKK